MDWATFSKELIKKHKQAGKPYHACFEMTPYCNFNCNMCFIHLTTEQAKAQGKLLETKEWLEIAKAAKRMGVITLEVTGGEAVTRPDFGTLYESLIKMGYIIHLRTNGYLIKDEILGLLTRLKPRKVSVTLYGASDLMYQKVCGVSDGFSVVSKNILAMKDAGINLRLTMTVTKDNVSDLQPLIQWAKENSLSLTPYGALINPIRSARRSVDHLQIETPKEEYCDPKKMLQFQHEISQRQYLLNPFWMCRGFGTQFCISWDGRMTICNTFTSIWSDPIQFGVDEAYKKLYGDLKRLERPTECKSCEYIEFCGACPSQLQSATGDLTKTCEKLCKMARTKYKHYLLHVADVSGKFDPPFIYELDEGGVIDED